MGIFGQMCSDPTTYYCSALPLSDSQMMNSYGQQMTKISAQSISSTSVACDGSSVVKNTSLQQSQAAVASSSKTTQKVVHLTDLERKNILTNIVLNLSKDYRSAHNHYAGFCESSSFKTPQVEQETPLTFLCNDASYPDEFGALVQMSGDGTTDAKKWALFCGDSSGFLGTAHMLNGTRCQVN